MKIMKSRCIEVIRITGLLLKKCSWISLIFISFVWSIFAIVAYMRFLTADILSNIKIIYAANDGSLLFVLIFYLSFGIEMIMVSSYLKHPLCEEYVYTRITSRATIITANIFVVAVINTTIILLEFFGIAFCLLISEKSKIKSIEIPALLQIAASVTVPRLTLSVVLLLSNKLGKNIITVFTILTAIIFSSILIDSDVFITIRNWLDVPQTNGLKLGMECLLIIALVCAVIGVDHTRDISLQEDVDKND